MGFSRVLGGWGKATVLWLALLWSARAQPALHPSAATALPAPAIVTNLTQLRSLTYAQALEEPVVRLSAVVLNFDAHWRAMFVGDGSAAAYIGVTNPAWNFVPGQMLAIEGRARPGVSPQILPSGFQVLSNASLPAPRPVSLEEITSTRYDCHRVVVGTVIRSMYLEYRRLILEFGETGGRFQAHLSGYAAAVLPTNLLNARVELTGVVGAVFNRQSQLTGIRVYLNSLDDIRLSGAGELGSSDLPPIRIASFSVASPAANDRLKLRGTVTASMVEGRLFLQDETAAIRVRLLPQQPRVDENGLYLSAPDPLQFRPGDEVEVVGFPALGEYSPVLSDAEARPLGTGVLPAPLRITGEEALTGLHDGQRVRLAASLLAQAPRRTRNVDRIVLTLRENSNLFEAVVPDDPRVRSLRAGSRLEVTGVCDVQVDDRGQPVAFRMIVPTVEEVRLVEAPPRFGLGHLLGVLSLVAAGVAGWGWHLRQKVRHQHEAISAGKARLEQSQERFRALLRVSPAMMTLTRFDDGRFVAANAAFLATTGYAEAEVLGKKAADLDLYAIPEQRVEFREILQRDGMVRDREHQVRCRDGRVVTALLSGEMIDIDGVPHALIVALDISERKRAEQDTVRALAAERELGELKSRFVSLVSHEFRTPLGITMSAVELLRHYADRLPEDKKEDLLNDIHRSTLRMSALMEQVLLLGRVEAGKVACQPLPMDLDSLGHRLVDEALSATNRHCPVEFEATNNLEGARADENLLRHALANLLSNAIKYSAEGSLVRLVARREGTDVVFQIVDRGIGIPEADQPRLFEAFQRATNVGQVSGTGLGLMIVKRCIELHGGAIQLQSREGEGTTFTVRVPVYLPAGAGGTERLPRSSGAT